MTTGGNDLLNQTLEELKEVLRQIVAQIQHLRVDQDVLPVRLLPDVKPIHILEQERTAQSRVVAATAELVARIEAL